MIVRTEAISLRNMHYGETSQIVTLYTRSHGKLAVLAKGARRIKSKFGASLQPMTYSQVVFYYKPSRQLQTLSESACIYPMPRLTEDLKKITVGLRIVELMQSLMHDEEPNPTAFNLLLQSLSCLHDTEEHTDNVFPYFQMRMTQLLGFSPAFTRESVEAVTEKGGQLSLEHGTIHSYDEPVRGLHASRGALRAFAIFARAELDVVMRMQLSPAHQAEVTALLDAFLRHHVGELAPNRTGKVIAQLMNRTK